MTSRRVVAVVGISGVGKSTMLAAARVSVPFTHLQASALIKDELRRSLQYQVAHDRLREAPIDINQGLLIAAFQRIAPQSGLVILDGHALIDTPGGVVEIGADIFRSLGIDRFVVLEAPPEAIFERRANDTERKRPSRSVAELQDQQDQSLAVIHRAGNAIGAPVTVIETLSIDHLIDLLSGEANRC